MADFFKSTKKMLHIELAEMGFKSDKLKEGVYKALPGGRYITVQVLGCWSYIELYCGIRFDFVNKILYESAIECGWPIFRAKMFKLELFPLFRKKIGDFCESVDDIGEFCPIGSQICSYGEIRQKLISEINKFVEIERVDDAINFARDNDLVYPFGVYTLPAAASTLPEFDGWAWLNNHVFPQVNSLEVIDHAALIASLREKGRLAQGDQL